MLVNHFGGFPLIKMELPQQLGGILKTAGFMLAALFQMAGAEACMCCLLNERARKETLQILPFKKLVVLFLLLPWSLRPSLSLCVC